MDSSKDYSSNMSSSIHNRSSSEFRIDLTSKVNIDITRMLPKCTSPQSPAENVTMRKSSQMLPTYLSRPAARKDEVLDKKVKSYITDGEGTDNASTNKIAEEKQVTTANIDRWKRTFQSLKNTDKKPVNTEDSHDDDVNAFYNRSRSLKSQASILLEDQPRAFEDIIEEMSLKQIHTSCWVINPDSKAKSCWDILAMLFVVILALVIPFKMAFLYDAALSWNIFENIIEIYFMIDICKPPFLMPRCSVVLQHRVLPRGHPCHVPPRYRPQLYRDLVHRRPSVDVPVLVGAGRMCLRGLRLRRRFAYDLNIEGVHEQHTDAGTEPAPTAEAHPVLEGGAAPPNAQDAPYHL